MNQLIESHANPIFTAIWDDGIVRVIIGKNHYEYEVLPQILASVRAIHQKNPWGAVNKLRRAVDDKMATYRKI